MNIDNITIFDHTKFLAEVEKGILEACNSQNHCTPYSKNEIEYHDEQNGDLILKFKVENGHIDKAVMPIVNLTERERRHELLWRIIHLIPNLRNRSADLSNRIEDMLNTLSGNDLMISISQSWKADPHEDSVSTVSFDIVRMRPGFTIMITYSSK